jgi:hypothetical protein
MRLVALFLAVLFVAASACSNEPRRPTDGHRVLKLGEVQTYDVEINQKRKADGPDSSNEFTSKVVLKLEEEALDENRFSILVRDAVGTGEESQIQSALRLKGRTLEIDLDRRVVRTATELFAGAEDVAASDIGMLIVQLAPLLPRANSGVGDAWRATSTVPVAWSQSGARFTINHKVTGERELRGLETATVGSTALSNVSFRIELVREVPPEQAQQEGGATADGRGYIVNQLFEELFTDIDDPVSATVAAFAAIPLAVVAPFIALLEGLAGLFGGNRSRPQEPETPIVILSGPVELKSTSDVWRHDGRVLGTTGSGYADLSGPLPELSGDAASLSGKALRLRSDWTYTRKLTSPWPDPVDESSRSGWLMAIAVVLTVVALALNVMSERRRRKLSRA